jgi:hypothetical protein
MSGVGIGKLERVALREVWKHEARDFTQWLERKRDAGRYAGFWRP